VHRGARGRRVAEQNPLQARGKITTARDAKAVEGFKADKAACEVCDFTPPRALAGPGSPYLARLLHAHHVVPVACGGTDDPDNLIVVCPTCHAVAHALGRIGRMAAVREWVGPRSRDELIEENRLLDDPEAWVDWIRAHGRAHIHEGAPAFLEAIERKRARQPHGLLVERPTKPTPHRASGYLIETGQIGDAVPRGRKA
jgi:hypothetical protein